MDYLREGIGLRAMAQRDPLVEYQREGGDMFAAMMDAFMEEVVGFLFNLEVTVRPAEPKLSVGLITDETGAPVQVPTVGASTPAPDAPLAKGLERRSDTNLTYSAPDETGEVTQTGAAPATATDKVGRNQPCPCGSGKKYKMCHGRPGA